MPKPVETDDINQLAELIREEILAALGDLAESDSQLRDIQPLESVLEDAAVTATRVIIAFERGYRLGG